MRFYKPRLREYVSTQVDMPWEFLQGVAEQKQKGYDSALAAGDAASKLLNFDVNPGDMPGKQHVQREYNNQLYKITDYIRQTGDFNTASREFANVIRNIAQDKRIQTMTGAVDPHKKVMESLTSLMEKGAPQMGLKADAMYATYDPATGTLRPYNQRAGYDAREISTKMRTDFENAVDNVVADGYGNTSITGQFYIDNDGKYLTREKLEPLIEKVLPTIFSSYSGYLSDLGNWDKQMGYKENSTFNNLVESVINERIFTQTSEKKRENPDWSRRQQKRLDEESSIISFTGATVPTNIDYNTTKTNITNLTSQISNLQNELNTNKSLNGMQKQEIMQQIEGLKSDLSRNKSQMDLVHKTMTTSDKFGINQMYEDYKQTLTELDPNAKPYSKDEFIKYMKEEKPIVVTNVGRNLTAPTSAEGVLKNKHMAALSAVKSNKYDVKAKEVASSGAVLNEVETLIDLNKNSNINKVTNQVLDGIFNNTLNATNAEGNNINKLILEKGAVKEKSEISLVKNPVSSEITYKVILRDSNGDQVGEHLISTNKSSPQLKQVINSGLKLDMKTSAETGNSQSFLNSASALAHTEYGNELAMLRNYANNNQVMNTPLKIGSYYVTNAVDNYNRPIPNQFIMGQGTIDDSGNVTILSNTIESNPNNPNSNILFYGDIESKLGVTLFRQ